MCFANSFAWIFLLLREGENASDIATGICAGFVALSFPLCSFVASHIFFFLGFAFLHWQVRTSAVLAIGQLSGKKREAGRGHSQTQRRLRDSSEG
jgi:hypothetical protein